MKSYTKKIISILLIATMCVTGIGISVFAEESIAPTMPVSESTIETPTVSTYPVNVKHTLTGEMSNMTMKLTWDPVTSDDDKKVYYAVKVNGVVTDGISECTYSVKGLTSAQNNIVTVGSYTDPGLISWNDSESKTIAPFAITPVTLESVSLVAKKDNQIKVVWTNPSDYEALKYGISSNGTLVVNNIDSALSKHTYRSVSGVRKIRVRSYSPEHTGVYANSNVLETVKIPSYLTYVHKRFIWRATFKSKATLYNDSSFSKKIGTVKKGVKGEAVGKYPKKVGPWDDPTKVKVELPDGRVGWVKFSTVKIKGIVKPKMDYPLSLKKEFVKDYSSETSYLVWVNQYTMRVNVFKGKRGSWTLVRSKRCTVGDFRLPLSYGSTYSLAARVGRVYRVNEDGEEYYFDLARAFHGSGYFHTRCHWTDGSIRNSVIDRPNTRGCVRLYDADARYIYNLPTNTKVVIY